MTPLEAHIRNLILLYLEGSATASQLYDQVPGPWDIDEKTEPAASELAAFVVGCLSGFQAGDRSADAVYRLLADKIATARVVVGQAGMSRVSSATATRSPFALPAVGMPA